MHDISISTGPVDHQPNRREECSGTLFRSPYLPTPPPPPPDDIAQHMNSLKKRAPGSGNYKYCYAANSYIVASLLEHPLPK